jgi:hypothetical protein
MKKFATIVGLFGSFTLCHAQIDFTANLAGSQEVPSNDSTATASAVCMLGQDFTITGSFQGLQGYVEQVYLDDGAPGVNGTVVLALPVYSSSGHAGTFQLGSYILTPQQGDALFDGDLYINIESLSFPNGEIRGQIELEEVPEPSTLALLAPGALALLARRRGKV